MIETDFTMVEMIFRHIAESQLRGWLGIRPLAKYRGRNSVLGGTAG